MERKFFQPHFKPDFNLDLLRSNNYICHFFAVRRETAKTAGGFRQEFEGAQDYDFIFPVHGKQQKNSSCAEDCVPLENTQRIYRR